MHASSADRAHSWRAGRSAGRGGEEARRRVRGRRSAPGPDEIPKSLKFWRCAGQTRTTLPKVQLATQFSWPLRRFAQPADIQRIGRAIGASRSALDASFKRLFGMTPMASVTLGPGRGNRSFAELLKVPKDLVAPLRRVGDLNRETVGDFLVALRVDLARPATATSSASLRPAARPPGTSRRARPTASCPDFSL